MNSYESLPSDTGKEALRSQYVRLKKMSREERALIVFGLNDMMRAMAETGIRRRHPDYDEESVLRAFVRLTTGERDFELFFSDSEARA